MSTRHAEVDKLVRMGAQKANSARMADYVLGGSYNFKADRDTVKRIGRFLPVYEGIIREQRKFLQRAVRYLAEEQGIDRFLDLGSGLPTRGNVHQIAQAINPEARVVYSDIDPISVQVGRALVADDPHVYYAEADARQVERLLADDRVVELFGDERRVGFIIVGLINYLPDDDVAHIASTLYEWAASGSYLVFTDSSDEGLTAKFLKRFGWLIEMFRSEVSRLYFRPVATLRDLLSPWHIVEPGIVRGMNWGLPPEQMGNEEVAKFSRSGVARKQ